MNTLKLAVFALSALGGVAFAQGAPPQGAPHGPPPVIQLPPVQKGKGPAKAAHYPKSLVQRGRYLVMFGGCNECHTPWNFNPKLGGPAPDFSRFLSGHPQGAPDPQGTVGPSDIGLIGPTFTSFKLPFGTIYSANLTPDVDTGTGTWTEKMFIDAFRKGKHMGGNGRPILPPMPWPDVATLNTHDLRAIYAFLRTVPPIHNAVPEPKVPPPVMDAMSKMNDNIVDMMKQMKEHGGKPAPKQAPATK